MEFSEKQGKWRPIPEWVWFLLNFGYQWHRNNPRPRRIALISMPCDSAAAGLVALGAMIRDLGDPKANDVDGHYEKLLSYARQFLKHCKSCDQKCEPEIKRCGYVKEATGILRSPLHSRKTFQISERTNFDEKKLAWEYRSGMTQWPTPQYAINWHIDGDPAPEVKKTKYQLSPNPYCTLLDGATINKENLNRSYSGLCFAGRITGEMASREVCGQIRLKDADAIYSLSQLLAIHEWSDIGVSRMAYFNSRSKTLDRNLANPELVVADGDVAFLKAWDYPEFQSCDVIGVISRAIDYDRLEAVGVKMQASLWFVADIDMLCSLPSKPRGISVAILKARNA